MSLRKRLEFKKFLKLKVQLTNLTERGENFVRGKILRRQKILKKKNSLKSFLQK